MLRVGCKHSHARAALYLMIHFTICCPCLKCPSGLFSAMLSGSSGEALTKVSSKDPPPPPGINLLNEVSVHKTKHTLEKVAKDVDGGRRVRFWCVFGLSEHHLSTRCFLSRVQLSGEMCASVCVLLCVRPLSREIEKNKFPPQKTVVWCVISHTYYGQEGKPHSCFLLLSQRG